MNRRAIILAGGKGSRLRPYTIVLPKPLMPIGEYPILEVVVRQLIKKGFNHITMAVNHQASLIKSFFGDGSKWSVVFDASANSDSTHFLHNTFTSKQFKWTGVGWISSYEGEYRPGYWRLVL